MLDLFGGTNRYLGGDGSSGGPSRPSSRDGPPSRSVEQCLTYFERWRADQGGHRSLGEDFGGEEEDGRGAEENSKPVESPAW